MIRICVKQRILRLVAGEAGLKFWNSIIAFKRTFIGLVERFSMKAIVQSRRVSL